MKRLRLALTLVCGITAAALTACASAASISGYFDDPGNAALIASDGFGDLEPAQFGSDDAVARNVAIYALTVAAPGIVEFASGGYAAGGAQPYLSIFAGSTTAATFVDSSYFDPDIDFDVMESLVAGDYLVAIGVYENVSFAENLGTGTLADGFTALGVPEYVGDSFYQVDLTSTSTFTIAPAPLGGAVGPPPTNGVPEPSDLVLVTIGGLLLMDARRRRLSGRALAPSQEPNFNRNSPSKRSPRPAMKIIPQRVRNLTFVSACAGVLAINMIAAPASAQTRAALVRDTDNAALAPAVLCQTVGGINANGVVNFLGAVPSGKRFVVQHVSYTATNATGNSIFTASLTAYVPSLNGYVPKLWLPVNPSHSTTYAVVQDASVPATTYYEAGESGQLVITDNGSGNVPGTVSACVTGFYVTP